MSAYFLLLLKKTVFWNVAVCNLVETGLPSEMLAASIIREVLTASITRILITAAVSTPKTLANFCKTALRNIAEDSHMHTLRRENLNLIQ